MRLVKIKNQDFPLIVIHLVTLEMVIQNQELDLHHLAFIDRNLQYSQIIFLHLNIWFILGYLNGEKE